MISPQTAAGLIASMMQGTKEVNPVWDTLPPEEIANFLTRWRLAISDSPDDAPIKIINSIANHPHLSAAWRSLDPDIHQKRANAIRLIIAAIE